MTATRSATVYARVTEHHHDQLRQLAVDRDTTVSRLVARAVVDKLAATEHEPAAPQRDRT
jgi:hypothetical protein